MLHLQTGFQPLSNFLLSRISIQLSQSGPIQQTGTDLLKSRPAFLTVAWPSMHTQLPCTGATRGALLKAARGRGGALCCPLPDRGQGLGPSFGQHGSVEVRVRLGFDQGLKRMVEWPSDLISGLHQPLHCESALMALVALDVTGDYSCAGGKTITILPTSRMRHVNLSGLSVRHGEPVFPAAHAMESQYACRCSEQVSLSQAPSRVLAAPGLESACFR